MHKIIDEVNYPKDLKNLKLEEKKELANEIRQIIIETVSKNGGHLASNLGVIELTIALHTIFDVPKDKIIWDVGHQVYTHKILTGRKEEFNTLRQSNGIAGFPKTSESESDCFDTGHSSTSISVALGMARANKLLKKEDKVIAVIGDGSLTGGMAIEGLNDAGSSKSNIIVVLNDNQMSISKNVGGIPMLLTKLRTKKFYTKSNKSIKKYTRKIPIIGKSLVYLAQKIKNGIKQLIIPNMYFEDIGFTYLGPVDGHDLEKLESIFRTSKQLEGPILIHVITKKGKGYKFAEENPDRFHGVSSFDIGTGKSINSKKRDYSAVFGEKLVELAKNDERIVAVTAAMKDGTGLKNFSEMFPQRFFDVGIAEQHAIGLIAGMAKSGLKPVFSVYSSFLQRGYDQLIHDIALQNIPAVICIDRAGIVGNDGETHQGIFDLSFLSTIPNINIMAPKDFKELEAMLEFAVNFNKPIIIRYPKGSENLQNSNNKESFNKIELGKAEIVKNGTDLTIIAIGKMVSRAVEVSNMLENDSINAEVINARFLKPIDKETILNSIEKTRNVITIEDNLLKSGLGTNVIELVNDSSIENIKIKTFGYEDTFISQGTVKEIEEKYGLSVKKIYNKITTLHNAKNLI